MLILMRFLLCCCCWCRSFQLLIH